MQIAFFPQTGPFGPGWNKFAVSGMCLNLTFIFLSFNLELDQQTTNHKEGAMEKKDLKKLVAGLSIAGLIAGAGLTMTGCNTA